MVFVVKVCNFPLLDTYWESTWWSMLVPTTSLLSVRMACLWLSNLEYHVQQLLVLNQPHHHWPPEAHQSHWLLLIIQCQQRSIHHPNHPSSGSTLAWWCTLATSSHCAWPTYGLLNFSSQGSFLVVTIIPIVAIHYSCIHIKKENQHHSAEWHTAHNGIQQILISLPSPLNTTDWFPFKLSTFLWVGNDIGCLQYPLGGTKLHYHESHQSCQLKLLHYNGDPDLIPNHKCFATKLH